jgi:DnaK suppressor protein
MAESATAMPDPVAVIRAARLDRTIGEIDAALQRIADGSYGTCVHCGAAIPPERLELRPFVSGCVTCAQRSG